MASPWLGITWNANKEATPKKRRPAGLVGTAARPRRAQPSAPFDLANEAVAMMRRTAFESALKGWARSSPRGPVVYAVVQALLGELRRAGPEALLQDERECMVRKTTLRKNCTQNNDTHAMPCRAVPCHAVPCHAMPRHAMPCHAVPCRAVPCHAVLCRALPCRAMLTIGR